MTATTYDRAAAGLGLACIAHCLALPMAAAVLPILGAVADAEWVHWLLTGLAILASGSVIWSDKGARNSSFLIPALIGLCLITFAVFAESFGLEETPPTVVGGLLLAGAHGYRILVEK